MDPVVESCHVHGDSDKNDVQMFNYIDSLLLNEDDDDHMSSMDSCEGPQLHNESTDTCEDTVSCSTPTSSQEIDTPTCLPMSSGDVRTAVVDGAVDEKAAGEHSENESADGNGDGANRNGICESDLHGGKEVCVQGDLPVFVASENESNMPEEKPTDNIVEGLSMVCDAENVDNSDTDTKIGATNISQRTDSTSAKQRKMRGRPRKRPIHEETINTSSCQHVLTPTSSAPINPNWLKPFEHGWKREVVMRGVQPDSINSPSAGRRYDVYYYSPDNVKLRSLPQITEYLEKTGADVTIDCFTFCKNLIYREPFETIRHAGKQPGRLSLASGTASGHSSPTARSSSSTGSFSMSKKSPDSQKLVFKIKQTNMASSSTDGDSTNKRPKLGNDGVGLTNRLVEDGSGMAPKIGHRPVARKHTSHVFRTRPMKHVPHNGTTHLQQNLTGEARAPVQKCVVRHNCGLGCPGLEGIPPSIGCSVCMCLFHPQCANMSPMAASFVCKYCSTKDGSGAQLPVSVLKCVAELRAPPPLLPAPRTNLTMPPLHSARELQRLSFVSRAPGAALPALRVLAPSSLSEPFGQQMSIHSTPPQLERAPIILSAGSTMSSTYITVGSVYPAASRNNMMQQIITLKPCPSSIGAVVPSVAVRSSLPSVINLPPMPPLQPATRGILPLPSDVASQLNLSQKVTLKMNSQCTILKPSDFIVTSKGVSVALPSNVSLRKVSSTVTNNNSTVVVVRSSSPVKDVINLDEEPPTIDADHNHDACSVNTTQSLVVIVPESPTSAPDDSVASIPLSSISSADDLTCRITSSSMTAAEASSPAILSLGISTAENCPVSVTKDQPMISPSSMCSGTVPTTITVCLLPPISASDVASATVGAVCGPLPTISDAVDSPAVISSPCTVVSADSSPSDKTALPLVSDVRVTPALTSSPAVSAAVSAVSDAPLSRAASEDPHSCNSSTETCETPASCLIVGTLNDKQIDEQGRSAPMDVSGAAKLPARHSHQIKPRNFFGHLHSGFISMLKIFRHLGVCDLMRAATVCQTWHTFVMHRSLWTSVRLQGISVTDWKQAARHFTRVGTEHLDLRGMILAEGELSWKRLEDSMDELITVRRVNLGPCPVSVVNTAAHKMWRIEQFTAMSIRDAPNYQNSVMGLSRVHIGRFLVHHPHIEVLQLRGVNGLLFGNDGLLDRISTLQRLRTLSLTTMRMVPESDLRFIGLLHNVTSLEIGDCQNWNEQTFVRLGYLTNLTTLRLESGGSSPDVGLITALSHMKKLTQLELIRYVIDGTLAGALPSLKQLQVLSIWPRQAQREYQAAFWNMCIMCAVCRMTFLHRFEWGIIATSAGSNSQGKLLVPILPRPGSVVSSGISCCPCPVMMSIDEFHQELKDKLANNGTKVRVFRVPG